MKKADLVGLAREINSVCELEGEDLIDDSRGSVRLERELTNVVSGDEPELDIYEEDEFSDKAWKTLYELGCQTAVNKLDKAEEEAEEKTEEAETGEAETGEAETGEAETEEAGTGEAETEEGKEISEYTAEDIQAMKLKDLKQLVKDEDLDIDLKKYKKQKDLAGVLLKALELVNEGEEDQYTQAPKKETKLTSKKEEKSAPKKETKSTSKKGAKPAKKPVVAMVREILSGGYTRQEFMEYAEKQGFNLSTAKTIILHLKKEKHIEGQGYDKRYGVTGVLEEDPNTGKMKVPHEKKQ